MSDEVVRVSTRVDISPTDAFGMFTTEVDAWWKQGPRYRPAIGDKKGLLRFEPRVGGRFLEIYDEAAGDVFEFGIVRVWDPPGRLVFTLGGRDFAADDPIPEVEVRFEPELDGTRISIEQRGWDELPADHPVRHGASGSELKGIMGLWWSDLLVALVAGCARGNGG